MKQLFTFLLFLSFSITAFSAKITIISSQQGGSYAVQDTVWKHNAISMGHNVSIEQNAFLSSYSNLAETDLLIVSSATVAISLTQIQTLKQFVLSGRPLYLQTEYIASASGNIAFDSMMHAVGANFQWGQSQNGQLTPMTVTGNMSNTPNAVSALTYFNAGQPGDGTGVEKFLEFNGKYYGFYYSDPAGIKGSVLTTSDQDWIWHNESPGLIQNMLLQLVSAIPTEVSPREISPEISLIFPNPANEEITIIGSGITKSTVRIISVSGQEFVRPVRKTGSGISIQLEGLPSGLHTIEADNRFYRFRKN